MGQSIRHIAVLAPPSLRASRAIKTAAALADREQARVTLLVTGAELERSLSRHTLDVETMDALVAEYEQARDRRVEALLSEFRNAGVRAETHLLPGRRTRQATLDWQEDNRPDLLVKDVSPSSHHRPFFFTPADWHLLRGTTTPLLLLGRQSNPGPVVTALDLIGSRDKPLSLDQRVLEWGIWFGQSTDSPVHAVHAFESVENLRLPFGLDRLMPEEDLDAMRREHGELLDRLSDRTGIAQENRHLLTTPPGRAIPDLCRDLDARALVLGTARRGRLERLVMGSTAESILHALDCDVLAVPPQRS